MERREYDAFPGGVDVEGLVLRGFPVRGLPISHLCLGQL